MGLERQFSSGMDSMFNMVRQTQIQQDVPQLIINVKNNFKISNSNNTNTQNSNDNNEKHDISGNINSHNDNMHITSKNKPKLPKSIQELMKSPKYSKRVKRVKRGRKRYFRRRSHSSESKPVISKVRKGWVIGGLCSPVS